MGMAQTIRRGNWWLHAGNDLRQPMGQRVNLRQGHELLWSRSIVLRFVFQIIRTGACFDWESTPRRPHARSEHRLTAATMTVAQVIAGPSQRLQPSALGAIMKRRG